VRHGGGPTHGAANEAVAATVVIAAATVAVTGVRVRAERGRAVRVLLGALCLMGPGRAPAPVLAAAEPVVAVEVSDAGFKPATLRLRKGDAVRLSLTSTGGEHCFAIDELRVEKRVRPGRVTNLDLTPDRVGRFTYYCCLEPGNTRLRGRLLISE